IWPQAVQPEDILEGLGLAAVQIGRVIVDTQQRRHIESILPECRAGSGVVANLQRIGDVECPYLFEIFDREIVAGEREELVRRGSGDWWCGSEPRDTGIQRRPVLGSGGGVVAVEDLALRPLCSSMAGGAIGCENGRTGREIAALRLIQRPDGSKDPQ